jgi:tetratricopeptide (TPR) repeat protein
MNTRLTTGCKALLLGSLICLSTWALALPSPKDIQASIEAGQFTQAETQLREVLREKPSSARAHYELGQVLAREGRYIEAQVALRQAQKLEPSLKFAASPQKFNELMRKLETETRTRANDLNAPAAMTQSPVPATTSATHAPAVLAQVPEPASSSRGSMPWGWLLLGVGALAAFALWLRRAASTQQVTAAPSYPLEAQGFGHNYNPAQAYPGSTYPGAPGNGMGSTVKGAVIGGLAGVAAGYALSKVLEGEHPSAAAHTPDSPNAGASYTPPNTLPDRPDFGTFDGGGGDSWDNADAGGDGGGGDSDNW